MNKRYRTTRSILDGIFHGISRLEILGVEHIPRQGGAILAVNHISRLDTPLLGVACPRQVHALIASKYQNHLLFKLVLGEAAIWVRRTDFDREALLKALDVLRQGEILGLAPEGTRSLTGALQPGKPGVAFLAARAGVPIIPTAITGTERMAAQFKQGRRMQLRVVFGSPFRLPKEGRLKSEELTEATALIMTRIAALLPPAYHGVYAGVSSVQEAEALC